MAIGAPAACCVGVITYGVIGSSELDGLKAACSGVPDATARPYVATPGTHRVATFLRDDSGSFSAEYDLLPSIFGTSDAAEAELVLCVEPKREELIESCPFDVSGRVVTVERRRMVRDARVVIAQTGVVIAQSPLYGTEPQVCADNEFFYDTTTTVRRDGSDVTAAAYEAFVRPHATGVPNPPVPPVAGFPDNKISW